GGAGRHRPDPAPHRRDHGIRVRAQVLGAGHSLIRPKTRGALRSAAPERPVVASGVITLGEETSRSTPFRTVSGARGEGELPGAGSPPGAGIARSVTHGTPILKRFYLHLG